MADDQPDATVEVHVDAPETETPDAGDTVAVVVDDGGDDDTDRAVDVEHRLTELENRVRDLESREYVYVTHEEVAAVVDDAVETAAVVAEVVAEDVAVDVSEDVAAVVAEEVAEDVSPHKTHWLERTFGEWTGKNGSGKGSK